MLVEPLAIENTTNKNRLDSQADRLDRRVFDRRVNDEEAECVWGTSERMRAIAQIIGQIADSDASVLICGESGVGKELVARALHQRSKRRNGPLVKVNCPALPDELLESELFGYERGAFTGAATMHVGRFEQADSGTLLLDEIAEMKPVLQAKLLHVLQDGEFTKLGSNKRVLVDVRVVAATNRDLESMLNSGDFREDLYYRLGVIELAIPPLRERREEIPALIDFFLARCSRHHHRVVGGLSVELRHLFANYDWPGNIRELENMINRIVILQDERLVMRDMLRNVERAASATAMRVGAPASGRPAIAELDRGAGDAQPPTEVRGSLIAVAKAAALKAERAAIRQTLDQVHWNRRKAAEILGVSYKTLLNKIKESGIGRD